MIFKDIRSAVMTLFRSYPGTSLLIVLTLALGVGSTIAMFALINGILLNPLPYPESQQLVNIMESRPDGRVWRFTSWPNFQDWKEHGAVFQSISAYLIDDVNLQSIAEPLHLPMIRSTANMFDTLGVHPFAGRFFSQEEERTGAKVTVLSESLWRQQFAANTDIVGRQIILNGESYVIIGIAPHTVDFPEQSGTGLWVPLVPDKSMASSRARHFFGVIARLDSNISVAVAQSRMASFYEQLRQQYPELKGRNIQLVSLQKDLISGVQPKLLILLGAVVILLLIACANVANLLLAQAAARKREIVIRIALGAGRMRIIRQLLAEGLILSSIACVIALALSYAIIRIIAASAADFLPRTGELRIDGRVLLFAFVLNVFTVVLFALGPALHVSGMRDGDMRLTTLGVYGKSQQQNLRGLLIAAEIMLSMVLLGTTGLLLRTIAHINEQDIGLQVEQVLTFKTAVTPANYAGRDIATSFYQPLLRELESIPGVTTTGLINQLPLDNASMSSSFQIIGVPGASPQREPSADLRVVSPKYFRVMGIPIVQGRDFSEHDTTTGLPVAIINDVCARQYFSGMNPVAQHVSFGEAGRTYEIIGVVRSSRQRNPMTNPQPEIDLSYLQVRPESTLYPFLIPREMYFVLRSSTPPAQLVSDIHRVIARIAPGQPVYDIKTMIEVRNNSFSDRRFSLLLLAVFAGVALALAASGVFGLVSFVATQSYRELGIRLALGSSRKNVFKTVIFKALRYAPLGVFVGLGIMLICGRLLRSLLYGVEPFDLTALSGAVTLITLIVICASLVPAVRATRVDPAMTLRSEN
jgi:putative ABC transport system permease protein